MGLLSRKPKIGTEEFCQQFYDTQIFHAIIAGEDMASRFWEIVFRSVAEVDKSFADIAPAIFKREMTALRMEVFGLAWRDKFKRDEFTIRQSIFTNRYLEENGRPEVWDIMGEYNRAIADSATRAASGERQDAWRVAQSNKARADMFDKWAEANICDPSALTEEEKKLATCVARVANRIGAEITRNDCILVKRLGARLAYRLGCDIGLNFEALLILGATIFGLYQGAKEAMKNVSLRS